METNNKANIPAWMLEKNKYDTKTHKSTKTSFLTKTIKEFSSVIQNEVFSEKFVHKKGYLQMIDARVKLITILVFMLICTLSSSLFTLILLAFVALSFVRLSTLNLRDYFKRVWLILPMIVFILSIPAATNLFIKGTPLFYIYRELNINWLPKELYFTSIGFLTIFKMALRIGVSISFAYVLIMTTRWTDITKAFLVFKIHRLIISILNMTYRYIFILSKLATDMMEARYLRTIGNTANKENRMFIAHRMSFLFIKSSYLSDEIYDAMRCRGFSGEPVSLHSFKIKRIDYLWILNNIVLLLVIVMGELIH